MHKLLFDASDYSHLTDSTWKYLCYPVKIFFRWIRIYQFIWMAVFVEDNASELYLTVCNSSNLW